MAGTGQRVPISLGKIEWPVVQVEPTVDDANLNAWHF